MNMDSLARRDRGLVGLGFLVGGIALPWLPGPWLPASAVTTVALAFLLPATALATCVGQAVFAGRRRTDDEPSRASSRAIGADRRGVESCPHRRRTVHDLVTSPG